MSMADTPSITIVKRFQYRGLPEEYSNTYHFSGTTPSDQAGWKTLADAVIAAERMCLGGAVSYVRAYGYEAGNEHSVATVDYVALGGTLVIGGLATPSGATSQPGDVAMWVRMKRPGRSSKGKNVYCRKYFHPAVGTSSDVDLVHPTVRAAMVTLANKLTDGTLPGSFRWTAPQGGALSEPFAGTNLTTRSLKRRGKRPSS